LIHLIAWASGYMQYIALPRGMWAQCFQYLTLLNHYWSMVWTSTGMMSELSPQNQSTEWTR